jgi:ankyrin repeat protein
MAYLLSIPGVNPNSRDIEGLTPLHLAVKSCEETQNTRTVKQLLLKGADR